jgi:hypothetical protein
MSFVSRRPGYDVTVDGGFVDRGRWVVHGVVTYRRTSSNESWEDVESDGRLDLMIGIARESRRGHAAGARRRDVVVEGDRELEELFGYPPAGR